MNFCREVKSKADWESFFSGHREKTFLQSWSWGDFNKIMGDKIWRFGEYSNNDLLLPMSVLKVRAKRGTFLLVQHCLGISEILLNKLKELAKKENCSFIRVAPLMGKNKNNEKLFTDFGFKNSPIHASAYEATLKLDLNLSEEDLLKNMRKTTRYIIRQALKNPEMELVKSNKTEDINLYQGLNEKIAKHQKFTPFSLKFVKNEFEVFNKENQALLFFIKYKEEIIASALVIFWSGIGFYHQAALDPSYHKIPAAYLLQWEAIREAKKRGCRAYDFWGYVDPKKQPGHPWAGPTLFKMGFGGKIYEYMETRDLPVSKKYWLTWGFEKIRSKKRGL